MISSEYAEFFSEPNVAFPIIRKTRQLVKKLYNRLSNPNNFYLNKMIS